MSKATDCSALDQQMTDYPFGRPDLDIAFFVVFFGVLLLVNVYKALSYALDVVSSACLLWGTFTRQFYLHNTPVGQWANDVCSAIMSDKELIFNYLAVSVVSWMASSFLECNFVIHFKKLYSTSLWRCLRWNGWSSLSRHRWLVLMSAFVCTVNSLALTLVVWGTVHHSFENVSKDHFIITVNTIAAMMRLLRQLVESLVFIAGIATMDFRWRNSREKTLMGRIAFSSFMLLIHTSVLTYTFYNLQDWSGEQLMVFSALVIDVVFRVVLCLWAAFNSCCYVRAKECVKNLTFQLAVRVLLFRNCTAYVARTFVGAILHVCAVVVRTILMFAVGAIDLASYCVGLVPSFVRDLLHFSFTAAVTLYGSAVSTVSPLCSCSLLVLHFCAVAVRISLMFAVGAIHLAYFCVSLVLTVFVEAWRDYVLHWHIDVDFDDPAIELVEPVQIQLVYQETQGHIDGTNREVVFPSYSVRNYNYDSHYTHFNVLANEILKSQYTTQIKHLPSVVSSSPSSTVSVSSHSIAPSEHEPLLRQEERESTPSFCLCNLECSPQFQSVPPSSHTSPAQSLPVRQRETLVAPSLSSTKHGDQRSELVAR